MNKAEIKLVRYNVLIRILVFVLQVLLSPLPDHAADAFNPPLNIKGSADSVIYHFIRGYRRWDAIYFCFIARWGYIFEHSLAFFPLLPAVLSFVANLFYPLVSHLLSLDVFILLCGIFLNHVLGLLCTILLYRLGCEVLGSPKVSFCAALLYCVNPALVFFSVVYSESLFFSLVLAGLLFHEKHRMLLAGICFALSCACRSNGMLNAGYVIYTVWSVGMKSVLWDDRTIEIVHQSFFQFIRNSLSWWSRIFSILLPCIFLCAICVAPFFLYQAFAYLLYCVEVPEYLSGWIIPSTPSKEILQYGLESGYRFPAFLIPYIGSNQSYSYPPWCSSDLPLSYSHIQSHYWKVKLLGYYELKQVPNFLLMLPVFILGVSCASLFYSRAPRTYRTLGLRAETERDRRLLPYIFHMLFLLIYGITHINVQVLTRMIFSSGPTLYWFAAYIISAAPHWHLKKTDLHPHTGGLTLWLPSREDFFRLCFLLNPWKHGSKIQKSILLYFMGYALVGCILHPKFLPWT